MKNNLYYGQKEAPPQKMLLQAGPLSLIFQNGDLRYIKLGNQEIIRRIYGAVRDQNWGTVPAEITNISLEVRQNFFQITYEASHQQADVDFTWQASLSGDEKGTITFIMDGVTHSTFQSNRIGFCVLHPAELCRGMPCEIEKIDGTKEKGVFPEWISPTPPFTDMRSISHEVAPDVIAEVHLRGDVFEMEDQRNYADSSYKIYSRPISEPLPFQVEKGAHIRQEVVLRLKGTFPSQPLSVEDKTPTFSIGADPLHSLPSIGLRFQMESQGLWDAQITELHHLHLSHLRIDLLLSQKNFEEAFKETCRVSEALAIPLEIAIFLSDNAEHELQALAPLLEQYQPQVCRWIVFHVDQLVTSLELIGSARNALSPYTPNALFGGGTNYTFAQVNMERPSVQSWDFLSFPVSPQIHMTDNGALVENLPGMRYCVESARQLVGDLPLMATPVSLKPHFTVPPSAWMNEIQPNDIPLDVDPRQMSLFGAGWTMGSLKHLAEAGVTSTTCFATTGLRGIMASPSKSNEKDIIDTGPSVYPMYHVFADVGEFADGKVIPTLSSDPHIVEGLAICEGNRLCVLVANLTCEAQDVNIKELPDTVEQRLLDETNALKAMKEPLAFRSEGAQTMDTIDGELSVRLKPFAILRLIGRR
jgi:hypothetical protein